MKLFSKRKLNWIDLSILLVMIALIASVLLRTGTILRFFQGEEEQTVSVSFLISNISEESAKALRVGEELYHEEKRLGTLDEMTINQTKLYLPDENGVLQITSSDFAKDVLCVVYLEGVQNDQGFYWNRETYLSPGQTLSISTEKQTFQILILDIAS